MKKLLAAILIFLSFQSFGQVDSSTLRSGKLTLRVNDWEYIATFVAYTATYESLFDSIKARIRSLQNYPSGATNITVDSVTNYELNQLCYALKNTYNKSNSTATDRIISVIRAISVWVTNRQNEWDADENATLTGKRNTGKLMLRKK